MITIVAPLASMAPRGEIGRSCREVSRVVGTLKPVDRNALLASLKDDRPIQFFQILDQMPGFSGIGLPAAATFRRPADAVPVAGILDLSTAVAAPPGRVTRAETLRISTVPGFGSFSAFIPVNHPQSVTAPCWVTLRLRVLAGHVGFAVFDSRTGVILARTPQIAGSPEPQTIALQVPDLKTATHVVIFNESALASGGLVEVWDAEVLVKPPPPELVAGPGRLVAR